MPLTVQHNDPAAYEQTHRVVDAVVQALDPAYATMHPDPTASWLAGWPACPAIGWHADQAGLALPAARQVHVHADHADSASADESFAGMSDRKSTRLNSSH